MIDIIIPAYNSQDTIIRTLSSIAMQLNREEIKVTIVNDGGEDYAEIVKIFSPILNIQEIGYEKNMGPGYARQYGIDHTDNELIIFIDADDTFYGANSIIQIITPLIEDDKTKVVISPFIKMGENPNQYIREDANLIWVFGHCYRRNFLNKHNIRFTSTRSNEDVGFNLMCYLIAIHETGLDSGKKLSVPTYEWQYNKNSITRQNNKEYQYGVCLPGYIYNCSYAYDIAQREGVTLEEMSRNILETAFDCFIYYCAALQLNRFSTETLKTIEIFSRKFYYKYYKQVQKCIPKNIYNQIYIDRMNENKELVQQIKFKMTFDSFVDFMFNKPVDEIIYKQLKTKIHED